MNTAILPLLELFAVVNDVMTEDDCMKKPLIGLGRIRREWKKTVAELSDDG